MSIGIPTNGRWSCEFAMSLIALLMRPIRDDLGLIEEPVISYHYVRSSNLVQNRHNLVRQAQKARSTHLLWLDDDMVFPSDTLARLLKMDEMIIGANCTTRAIPIVPTAVKDDQRITSFGKHGLEPIDQFGLAVVLVNMEVYDKIPAPWFKMEWSDEFPDHYMSEDMYFCRKAKEAGYRIYVDHDLSNEIGHVGELTFDHSMVDSEALAELNEHSLSMVGKKVA